MYINKMIIKNFRQLKDVTLELQANTTILAGPNNSGKTTIVLLLKRIFKEKSFSFGKEDLPAFDSKEWSNKTYSILKKHFISEESKENEFVLNKISDEMFPIKNENSKNYVVMPEFLVKFEISYDKDDDIRNFSNYIMDLDENINSFYFIYKSEFNQIFFIKFLQDNFEKFRIRFSKNEDEKYMSAIKDMLIELYTSSLETKCYFCDSEYKNLSQIEHIQDFKSLFNFDCIGAARPLGDSIHKEQHLLSESLVSLAETDQDWKEEIRKLPDEVLSALNPESIKGKINKVSTKALNETISAISETNGNHTGDITIDINITEDNVNDLINKTTSAKYLYKDYLLNENSQGLGYSNLIYLHIKIQNYIKLKDHLKVNLLVIEEPESHMHPQMQNVFSNKLLQKYDDEGLQGLITTHSNEIVKGIGMNKLRVIREITPFNSKIFNLSSFIKHLKMNNKCDNDSRVMLENFHNWFFEIGFSEIVFADAAILYEGDTERLYFKKIVTLPTYKKLQEKYIAYIQVGNAYAYNYKDIIEFLQIKTLIITDVDYDCIPTCSNDILKSRTTNASLINFYNYDKFIRLGLEKPETFNLHIEELYSWIKDKKYVVSSVINTDLEGKEEEKELIYLAFQTEDDKFTRTLEAAMLSKKFDIMGYESFKRSEWLIMKKNCNLKFSIPDNSTVIYIDKDGKKVKEKEKDSDFTLWNILKSTSNGKTDFMYSVILEGGAEEMLPNYIKEGLKWLMS